MVAGTTIDSMILDSGQAHISPKTDVVLGQRSYPGATTGLTSDGMRTAFSAHPLTGPAIVIVLLGCWSSLLCHQGRAPARIPRANIACLGLKAERGLRHMTWPPPDPLVRTQAPYISPIRFHQNRTRASPPPSKYSTVRRRAPSSERSTVYTSSLAPCHSLMTGCPSK
jgi:hypothetical protein